MPKFPLPNDVCYIIVDGKILPLKGMPEEQKAIYNKRILENVSRVMSDYYSQQLGMVQNDKPTFRGSDTEPGR